MLHLWNIHLHLGSFGPFLGVNVGKYSSSMEHLGSQPPASKNEVLENLNESHPGPRQRVADVGIEPLIWERGGFEIWKIHGQNRTIYGTSMENLRQIYGTCEYH